MYAYTKEEEGDLNTDRQRGEGDMKKVAEIGVMWPQAMEFQQTLKAQRGKGGIFP